MWENEVSFPYLLHTCAHTYTHTSIKGRKVWKDRTGLRNTSESARQDKKASSRTPCGVVSECHISSTTLLSQNSTLPNPGVVPLNLCKVVALAEPFYHTSFSLDLCWFRDDSFIGTSQKEKVKMSLRPAPKALNSFLPCICRAAQNK